MKRLKELFKLVLSNKLIRLARRKIGGVYHAALSSTYLLSIPFSYINPLPFMREQRAVRSGKGRYYRNISNPTNKTMASLRRNIHRLEKALIMRPRRESFAQDYILETVEWYRLLVNKKNDHDSSEVEWAGNVLNEYFATVKPVGSIKEAKIIFKDLKLDKKINKYNVPYSRSKPQNLPSYEQLLALSQYRRSVRWFLDKKVSRNVIDKALLIARQSPTACNRMPYEFRIFDEPELVNKIANIPFGTGGYADNIKNIVVVVGKLDSYFSSRDRHAIYTDASLAIMGFVYALEVQGIATCLINWPDFEPLERRMQKKLNLNLDERPIMLIALGYEDTSAMVPSSTKKDLGTIRRYN